MKNTVYGLKRLLGRKLRDPHVQREIQYLPFNVVEEKNGSIGIKVSYISNLVNCHVSRHTDFIYAHQQLSIHYGTGTGANWGAECLKRLR